MSQRDDLASSTLPIVTTCAEDPPSPLNRSNRTVSLLKKEGKKLRVRKFEGILSRWEKTVSTWPRLPPVSKPFTVSSHQFPSALAAPSSVIVARFRLIKVSVHVPLESRLQSIFRSIIRPELGTFRGRINLKKKKINKYKTRILIRSIGYTITEYRD